ncbi:hypothetical protein KM043_010027 [Ampulex compressa]|nr:hypothetical protein KM043_010027 [Ampulex compressa]
MAGLRVCRLLVILGQLALVFVLGQNPVEEKTTFEAAFQGLKRVFNALCRAQANTAFPKSKKEKTPHTCPTSSNDNKTSVEALENF